MAGGFTEEQRNIIRAELIAAGSELSVKCGIKKMTVAMVANAAKVAVGSFYNFFDSKESFVIALMEEYEKNAMKQMSEHFSNDGTITLKEFLSIYRENYKPENNFLLQIGLNDWVWFKYHLKDSVYLNKTSELEKYELMFTKIKGIRQDADPGVVVNFIKSIYAMYQNRDTLFEESLQTNVDLIFDSIYRYLKEEC
ncbi:MAG: TetR/AcrR family transcriptional regulator [Lachnospiraceae bacterium]|nr:TetR/AcrR family transcriptional regulator [Lachnospiraceae bacterium]